MTRRTPASPSILPEGGPGDIELSSVLESIEREETPERLLKLALELQKQLQGRKQRQMPN